MIGTTWKLETPGDNSCTVLQLETITLKCIVLQQLASDVNTFAQSWVSKLKELDTLPVPLLKVYFWEFRPAYVVLFNFKLCDDMNGANFLFIVLFWNKNKQNKFYFNYDQKFRILCNLSEATVTRGDT